jgi:hypothetical protein
MVDTIDLFNQAMEKQPVDFAATFDQLMRQKAQMAVASYREEMAQNIYNDEENEINYDDDRVSDDDSDEDDFILTDEDLEAMVNDGEDYGLDLSDLGLEDNEE